MISSTNNLELARRCDSAAATLVDDASHGGAKAALTEAARALRGAEARIAVLESERDEAVAHRDYLVAELMIPIAAEIRSASAEHDAGCAEVEPGRPMTDSARVRAANARLGAAGRLAEFVMRVQLDGNHAILAIADSDEAALVRLVAQAKEDARLLGSGWVQFHPDGTATRVNPDFIAIRVISPATRVDPDFIPIHSIGPENPAPPPRGETVTGLDFHLRKPARAPVYAVSAPAQEDTA